MAASGANVVVLGAGVLGLTVALQLARRGYNNITIVARHMPGDCHPEYTSIWAGANFVPVSEEGSECAEWDKESWRGFKVLANSVPAAGVWLVKKTSYYRNQDEKQEDHRPWFKDLVDNFLFLEGCEVPEFADWGTEYRTIAIDPSIYLHYLQATCLSLGVRFHRQSLGHIHEAWLLEGCGLLTPEVVVNCSGLQASTLGGVEDKKMRPIRGQLVIVENEARGMWSLSGDDDMDKSVGENCYIIGRPAGECFRGGTALGGSYHYSTNREPDGALTQRILARALKVCPGLAPYRAGAEALRVIQTQVGLRPEREGGIRIEREEMYHPEYEDFVKIVHCYGAGGFGFQSSYGIASKAASLVDESLGVRR